VSWRAFRGDFQVPLRQRKFQVSVSNGRLTHFHPVKDRDREAAKAQAYQWLAQFVSRLSMEPPCFAGTPYGMDWELLDSSCVEVLGSAGFSASPRSRQMAPSPTECTTEVDPRSGGK
jgi:hypothetical protein